MSEKYPPAHPLAHPLATAHDPAEAPADASAHPPGRAPEPAGTGRRQFMQTSASLGAATLLPATLLTAGPAHAAGTSLEGYTASPSVLPGGTLDFFLRDPQAVGAGTTVYPVTITRIGAPDTGMLFTQTAIGNQTVPADASANGCRWVSNFRLTVPATWPSGLYFAYVGSGANACTVPFVVRAATPTAGVKMLLQIPVSTTHAYNAYGGKSLYDFNSSGNVRSPRVSLDRPFTDAFNSFFDSWAQWLVRWMAKNGVAADFCTDIDVIATPAILDGYTLFASVGHDEYWTLGRRRTVDAFVARGGNVAFFGANTSWFQMRIEPGPTGVANRSIVCYKDPVADPATDAATKTTNFVSLTPPNPENQTTGLSFLNGCSWTSAIARPDTPWLVQRDEHWVLAGTGLGRNTGFGGRYTGYECDACLFTRGAADARPHPTATDGTPATLRVLALADGSNWNALSLAAGGPGEKSGWAMISVFSRGNGAGTVFNAGSVDWSLGLVPELNGQGATPISRITRNVIDKLSARWTESADVRQWSRSAGPVAQNLYYGLEASAPTGSAMALDGLAFRAFPAAVAGSVAVYRFRSAAASAAGVQYRYATTPTLAPVNGIVWVLDGIAFHAFASAGTDTQPVYEHRISDPATGAFWVRYSTSAAPPAGWTAGPVVFHGAGLGSSAAVVPGFSLVSSSAALALAAGQGASATLQVLGSNGFARPVVFSVSGLPAGVSGAVSPVSISPGGSGTLSLASTAAAVPGRYTVTVSGSAAATATQPASSAVLVLPLEISAAATPVGSFGLTPDTRSCLMWLGGIFGESIDVVVNRLNGFTGTVAFSVSGLPAGMAASFSPASSGTGTRLSLRATSWLGAERGRFTLTISGSAGTLRASTTVALTVW